MALPTPQPRTIGICDRMVRTWGLPRLTAGTRSRVRTQAGIRADSTFTYELPAADRSPTF